ncbi:hypothetical protein [Cupriavidus numazuensis]|uniref:Lipoprotein n=1 Tax=Cupriavidus numazuensis TaxID=221992 RepID=A0ABN7QBM8_9BURK|nr:hypothetical protein [Cupriavidus numazuensis]CAG2159393.1 hypothetical protein LMG26411_06666 [Cupriavidus numazuensis]
MPFSFSGFPRPSYHAATARLVAIVAGALLSGCSVVGATIAVGSAAVSTVTTVGSAAVSVASTAVETTYDVTKAGVKAVAGSDNAAPAQTP